MKIIINTAIALLIGISGYAQAMSNSSSKKMNAETAIQQLLKAYESALLASDTDAALALYTEDGVFMPAAAPTSVGKEAVRGAYDYVFSQIKLNIAFEIDEIVVDGDYAFARTISRGTTDILATGANVPEENRELFVLQKVDGSWKIARYMFNKMSPAE